MLYLTGLVSKLEDGLYRAVIRFKDGTMVIGYGSSHRSALRMLFIKLADCR